MWKVQCESIDKPACRERAAFTMRLKQAFDAAGYPGIRPTAAARMFNAQSPVRVTTHAVRKWLMSGCIPSQGNIRTLSKILLCDAAWLRYGAPDGPVLFDGRHDAEDMAILSDMASLDDETRMLAYDLIAMLLRKTSVKRNSRRR